MATAYYIPTRVECPRALFSKRQTVPSATAGGKARAHHSRNHTRKVHGKYHHRCCCITRRVYRNPSTGLFGRSRRVSFRPDMPSRSSLQGRGAFANLHRGTGVAGSCCSLLIRPDGSNTSHAPKSLQRTLRHVGMKSNPVCSGVVRNAVPMKAL